MLEKVNTDAGSRTGVAERSNDKNPFRSPTLKSKHLVLSTALAVGIGLATAPSAFATPQRAHPAQTAQPSTRAAQAQLPTPAQLMGTAGKQLGGTSGGAGGARATALYSVNGTGSSAGPGGLGVLDPTTFAGVPIAVFSRGANGITFTQDGRCWATTGGIGGGSSTLHELDVSTGTSLSSTPLGITVCDLTTQPSTGKIFALEVGTGVLVTIDELTGIVTPIGANGVQNYGGLAFAPDGTLYLISSTVANPILLTLDPATGAALSTISYGPINGLCGLEVRSDGVLLATRGAFAGGDAIVQVDPVTGTSTIIGTTGIGTPSDIAFDAATCQLDLGFGGPGLTTLEICGEDLLTIGNSATLEVSSPLVTTPGVLAIAPGFNPIPFLGGTLVPTGSPFVLTNFITDGAGQFTMPVVASGGVPTVLYVQAGVIDLSLPGLVQLSNGVQLTIAL
jgi:hypothetical protein